MNLIWLNSGNPTGIIQTLTLRNLLDKFPNEKLVGLEIGSAYGGGVEAGAGIWKGRGDFYGFDTFTGHPRDLAVSPDHLEATCMDFWYKEEAFGTAGLSLKYQQNKMKEAGIDNAHFVKGRVEKSSFDQFDRVHFAMIDLDMIGPTKIAYEGIKDKIAVGGYLFMHDALPQYHLPLINEYVYDEILKDGRWKILAESNKGNLVALEKWVNINGSLNNQQVSLNGEL